MCLIVFNLTWFSSISSTVRLSVSCVRLRACSTSVGRASSFSALSCGLEGHLASVGVCERYISLPLFAS